LIRYGPHRKPKELGRGHTQHGGLISLLTKIRGRDTQTQMDKQADKDGYTDR
jgi:hypothetical protein